MFEEYDQKFDAWLEKVRQLCKYPYPLPEFSTQINHLCPHDYFDSEATPEEFAAEIAKNILTMIRRNK